MIYGLITLGLIVLPTQVPAVGKWVCRCFSMPAMNARAFPCPGSDFVLILSYSLMLAAGTAGLTAVPSMARRHSFVCPASPWATSVHCFWPLVPA